ncbi:hypothetical protein DINM_021949 [Dirofilaria immitis]|nr:hypothetical protein [Dirofilaria immitis]
MAAAPASPTLYEITSQNGDYHQFIDNDNAATPIASAQAEVYSQLSPTPTTGQLIPTYSGTQYLPQRAVVPSESKTISSAQYSVPTYTAGTAPYYTGYFESLQCFSGDTTVQTPNQIKRIDELRIGDQVLSIEESLENGEVIKLTDYHLLYVTGCTTGEKLRLTFAKDVRLGHCLHVVMKQSNNLMPVKVSNIQRQYSDANLTAIDIQSSTKIPISDVY